MTHLYHEDMDEIETGYEEIAKIEEFVEQCVELLQVKAVPKLPVYFWCLNVEKIYEWVDGEELYRTIMDLNDELSGDTISA
jgi:hypothetical protein